MISELEAWAGIGPARNRKPPKPTDNPKEANSQLRGKTQNCRAVCLIASAVAILLFLLATSTTATTSTHVQGAPGAITLPARALQRRAAAGADAPGFRGTRPLEEGEGTAKNYYPGRHFRQRRSMAALLMQPGSELRVSGSKSEPPSRPSVDWSKQRPYFGPDMVRNASVELGKTAYLTCKVFELGDKTVSWLRPRENEILTSGRYTYIGDSRFSSINDNGSHDWILEIKDVGLNDSTSYECQVSTDPKMSTIINLQVKAAKSKIRQGEQLFAHAGNNVELTCETNNLLSSQQQPKLHQRTGHLPLEQPPTTQHQQTYWYFNGNLLNYARSGLSSEKNFTIEWDSYSQASKFKLFNAQLSDAGNYTCKPTSAEPSTIRLHVKRANKNRHYTNGYHTSGSKEAQRNNRQQHDLANSLELADSGADSTQFNVLLTILIGLAASWLQRHLI